jgi:Fur family peroxide stress response transcriptional regulator
MLLRWHDEAEEVTPDMYRDPLTRLRDAGYRVTPQRMAVYEHVRSMQAHQTTGEVHRAVQDRCPKVSLATVYNALESLVNVGLVRCMHRGRSAARYEIAQSQHAHFRCVACDEIRDVPMTAIANAANASKNLKDCELIDVNVEFVGYCPKCRRQRFGLPPADGA